MTNAQKIKEFDRFLKMTNEDRLTIKCFKKDGKCLLAKWVIIDRYGSVFTYTLFNDDTYTIGFLLDCTQEPKYIPYRFN